jgi:hypothetical protein
MLLLREPGRRSKAFAAKAAPTRLLQPRVGARLRANAVASRVWAKIRSIRGQARSHKAVAAARGSALARECCCVASLGEDQKHSRPSPLPQGCCRRAWERARARMLLHSESGRRSKAFAAKAAPTRLSQLREGACSRASALASSFAGPILPGRERTGMPDPSKLGSTDVAFLPNVKKQSRPRPLPRAISASSPAAASLRSSPAAHGRR